ncbi:Mob1/phocein [Syncephalis plumigaleata]|nr:Mob1/phocein [Syncephalis plumigaleata]
MLLASRKPRHHSSGYPHTSTAGSINSTSMTSSSRTCGEFPLLMQSHTISYKPTAKRATATTLRKITRSLSNIFPSRKSSTTSRTLSSYNGVKSTDDLHHHVTTTMTTLTPSDRSAGVLPPSSSSSTSSSCGHDSHTLSSHRPTASIKMATAIFDGPRMASASTPNMIERNGRHDTPERQSSSSATTTTTTTTTTTGKHLVPVASRLSGDLSIGLDCLQKAVKLPTGEQVSEWMIVHAIDFFNQVNLLYRTIVEFCTPRNCPVMSAGDRYQYRWVEEKALHRHSVCLSSKSTTTITSASIGTGSDCGATTICASTRTTRHRKGVSSSSSSSSSRAILIPAPDYIDNVMQWGLRIIDDPQLLSGKPDKLFARMLPTIIRTLFKRLFRIFAHIYHAHLNAIQTLEQEAHLNTSFTHFILFAQEFNLIDERELHPMAEVIALLTRRSMPSKWLLA